MIRVDISKCTGCRRCESACAFFHTGRINNHISRIKVQNLYEIGIDGPVVCIHCHERYCLCCPDQALSLGSLGQVIVSPTLCSLCQACEKACPIGAIEIFNGFVYVCDLCGGKPKCVAACTEGAITSVDGGQEAVSLAEYTKQAKKLNPGERRALYLKKAGLEARKRWRKKFA